MKIIYSGNDVANAAVAFLSMTSQLPSNSIDRANTLSAYTIRKRHFRGQ